MLKVVKIGCKVFYHERSSCHIQRNLFYSLTHLLLIALSRVQAISKITREPAEIIGAQNIGKVRQGFKASFVVWSGGPFSLASYLALFVAK